MAPPSVASAQQTTRRHVDSGASGARRGARRAPLRIVPSRKRGGARTKILAGRQARVLNILSISLVVGTLLAVVVAQAVLANGQVKLAGLQHQLALEQSLHRQGELAVAQLETPSRIVGSASTQLHMVRPAQVTELPFVSLAVPLPTPKVTPGPAAPARPAVATTSASSTGGAAGGASAQGSSAAPTTGRSSTPAPPRTRTSTP